MTDNGVPNLADSETITVTVNELNVAPVLGAIGNQTVNELALLSFTATASDADDPANTLSFSLASGTSGAVPAGASIDPGTGVFSWTPTEAQGPGTYTFDVVVTDNGVPNLADSETITVTVNELNVAPVLDAIGNQTVNELALLSFTATASDADDPANTLSFQSGRRHQWRCASRCEHRSRHGRVQLDADRSPGPGDVYFRRGGDRQRRPESGG